MHRAVGVICGNLRRRVFGDLAIVDDNVRCLVELDIGKHGRYLGRLLGRQRTFRHRLGDGAVVMLAMVGRTS